MNKQVVLSTLAAKGVKEVQVGFSGGGDEGGAEDMLAFMQSGDQETIDLWNSNDRQLLDKETIEALQEPIYEKYGGFAGDFHVTGTLIWNVPESRVTFGGQEQAYVPFEEEY